MPLVVDIKIPGWKRPTKSSLTIDIMVAQRIRRVAHVERLRVSDLLSDMLDLYADKRCDQPNINRALPLSKHRGKVKDQR